MVSARCVNYEVYIPTLSWLKTKKVYNVNGIISSKWIEGGDETQIYDAHARILPLEPPPLLYPITYVLKPVAVDQYSPFIASTPGTVYVAMLS